jgi:hypothetical protein
VENKIEWNQWNYISDKPPALHMVPEYLLQVSYSWISIFMRVFVFNEKMDKTISKEEQFENNLILVKLLNLFFSELVNIAEFCIWNILKRILII